MKTIVAIRIDGKIGLWEFQTMLDAGSFVDDCLRHDPHLDFLITVEEENEETKKSKTKERKNVQRKNRSKSSGIGKSKKSR